MYTTVAENRQENDRLRIDAIPIDVQEKLKPIFIRILNTEKNILIGL